MITLLISWESDVHMAVANALFKLSVYGKITKISISSVVDELVAEYQESIQSAIPQINALFHNSNKSIVHQVGAHILPKISGQGKMITFFRFLEYHWFYFK